MPQVNRTDQAELDLIDILVHLGRHSSAAADRFAAEFERKCELLAQFPALGEARDDLKPGVRSLVVGNYVLIYRPRNGGIEVLRVFRGGRHITPRQIP
ncbi:MAG TPA: type II toxin-antitoxin system RelE/ParE family toxin [Gemmataceae bacterium]|jgi:toxin ParE1/3/4